jgi:4-hydroxybenzoate polyprenyltransferase
MAQLDKLKEEIGWLRAIFTIIVVTDISLVAWLAQNYTDTKPQLLVGCLVSIIVVTSSVISLNRVAYQKTDKLEGL